MTTAAPKVIVIPANPELAPTGRSCYSAKYALTERLVCGECGTLYRRCVWTKRGEKFAVWRCASRVDYGKKYCHHSPTLREEPLQTAILAAINAVMSQRKVLVGQIESTLRTTLVSLPGGSISVAGIDRKLGELDKEFQTLFADSQDGGFMKHADEFKRITEDMGKLKEQRANLLRRQNSDSAAGRLIQNAVGILKKLDGDYTPDRLTDFLETINQRCRFDYWFLGHYHMNRVVDDRFIVQWERMVELKCEQ